MRKQANILESLQHLLNPEFVAASGATWAAGDAMFNKLRSVGETHSPTLFEAAYRHGRDGKQINLHTQGMLQNVLGRDTAVPMQQGRKMGEYMRARGFSPEQEARYLALQSEAANRSNRAGFIEGMGNRNLKQFDKQHVPYASELEQLALRQNVSDEKVQRIISAMPDDAARKRSVQHLIPDATLAATAPFTDARLATRPLFRRVDETKLGRKVDQLLQPPTAPPTSVAGKVVGGTKKGMSVTKRYLS